MDDSEFFDQWSTRKFFKEEVMNGFPSCECVSSFDCLGDDEMLDLES